MTNRVYQIAAQVAEKFPDTANTVYQVVTQVARNAIQYLHVTGAIGNHKIDTHVMECRRYAHLCMPGQRATIKIDDSFPGPIQPGLPVTLYESGVKVLTGYVVRASKQRPMYEWAVEVEDTFTRVSNYFIDEELSFDTPQSAFWLFGQILDPTGISYVIHGTDSPLPAGTTLGLRAATDALNDVMTYGSWYAWVDAEGVLQIKKHIRSAPLTVRDPLQIQFVNSTEQTRNVVKVYGFSSGSSQVNVQMAVNVPGLIVDLNTVVANPLLKNYDDAERVANYLIQELGSQTKQLTFDVLGDPTISIGTSGSLYYEDPKTHAVTSGSGPITSLESKVDKTGYTMTVTIGERCPRISGWSVDPRELRSIWIACRGGVGDPQPEKLVWTGDYGAGGQPTYNLVKNIPSGNILGMQVTRNGRRVYLITGVQYLGEPGRRDALWYCDNPYSRDSTWTRIFGTGDYIGPYMVDRSYFNRSPFLSMQMVSNTLHFAVRTKGAANTYRPYACSIVEQSNSVSTETLITVSGAGALDLMVGNYYYAYESGNFINFRRATDPPPANIEWQIPNRLTFGIGLWNGVCPAINSIKTGNWWENDLDSTKVFYVDEDDHIRYNRDTVYSGANISNSVRIRGDYWGSQSQFVDLNGNLLVGFGGAFYQVFQWGPSTTNFNSSGAVLCIDKTLPSKMAWFPQTTANANEMSRYSSDGGRTWTQMTGNWWGSNGDVVAGRAMQSVGGFSLIDAHPTFWSSEAPSAG